MTKSLNDTALSVVAQIEAFDRDCEAVDYTDIDAAWVIFHKIAGELRAHLGAGQLQELAELKTRHEAEIEREAEAAQDRVLIEGHAV